MVEKAKLNIFWLIVAAAASYFPFALLGFGFWDQGAALGWSRLLQQGTLFYRDFPLQLPPFSFIVNVSLSKAIPGMDLLWISCLWRFLSYLAVAFVSIRFANRLLEKWASPPLSRGSSLLWIFFFFLAGPIHEPYANYTHDSIVLGIIGILLLAETDKRGRTNPWRLLLGSFCLGMAATAYQVVGMVAMTVGVLILGLRWFRRTEPPRIPLLLSALSLGTMFLAPAILFFLLAKEGILNDFLHWTVAVPAAVRMGRSSMVRSLSTFSTTFSSVLFPLLAWIGLVWGGQPRLQTFWKEHLKRRTTMMQKSFLLLLGILGLVLAASPSTGRGVGASLTAGFVLLASCWAWWQMLSPPQRRLEFSGVYWGMTILAIGFGVYVAAFHQPTWISLLTGQPRSAASGYAWGVKIGIRAVLVLFWTLGSYAIGSLWNRKGGQAAMDLAVPLLGLFALYSGALISGYSTVRLFRTLPPLTVVGLLLLTAAQAGLFSMLRASHRSRTWAACAILLLLVVIRLRGPEWMVADPLRRPVRYYPPLHGFMDSTLAQELDEAQRLTTGKEGELLVYEADPIFYYFLNRRPPTIALVHDSNQGVRTAEWDARELKQLHASHVQTVLTLACHQRTDSFLFRREDPIRDWIEQGFQPVYMGKFIVVWQRSKGKAA